MAWPDPIQRALLQTQGAVFRRCALQVNPFAYVQRHRAQTTYTDEATYNADLVEACLSANITVVGIADHHTGSTMATLREAFTAGGITVFPGFEVYSADGVHALVLFDPTTEVAEIERWLGRIGVTDPTVHNGLAALSICDVLDLEWPAVVIPEATRDRGLLTRLQDQPRMRAWKHERLLAVAVPCRLESINDQAAREILRGIQTDYAREHPPAMIFAADVYEPAAVSKDNASTWLKMTEPTIEGLRAAFRDPESRVRLPGDAEPPAHPQVEAIAWTGGFLKGSALRLGENLNVLIGGRGAGKSTVIESLRYALDLPALGEAPRRAYEGVITKVLGAGAVVEVLVASPYPEPARYLVRRTVPHPPVVLNENGEDLGLRPSDIIGSLAVWGQHEIAELEEARAQRRRLIERFAPTDLSRDRRKAELRRALRKNAGSLVAVEAEFEQIEARLAGLPALQERLARYRDAGVEQRLREQSDLVREEGLLRTAQSRLQPAGEEITALLGAAQLDRAFIADPARKGMPNEDLLAEVESILAEFERSASALATQLSQVLDRAEASLADVLERWTERRDERQEEFAARLRELHADDVDAGDFLVLRRELESLLPLAENRTRLSHEQRTLEEERASLLAEWRQLRADEHAGLQAAADHVSEALAGRVQVRVTANGEPSALKDLLRQHARAPEGGRARLSETEQAIERLAAVDPTEMADMCRRGPGEIERRLEIPTKQARLVCDGGEELFRQIEELDLEAVLTIELNLGSDKTSVWRPYDALSKGQRATAALLLLLLGQDRGADGAGPLIIDQPEDDLDHKFVFESIVPAMREEKRRRQFVFATHDPNIPVLGDAELIAVMRAHESGGRIVGSVGAEGTVGSIDVLPIRADVEENLEGGRAAFERRRRMYGF